MKINAGSVSMASSRSYQKLEVKSSAFVTSLRAGNKNSSNASGNGTSLSLSSNGLSNARELREKLRNLDGEGTLSTNNRKPQPQINEISDGELEIMKRILEILKKSLRGKTNRLHDGTKSDILNEKTKTSSQTLPTMFRNTTPVLDFRTVVPSGAGTTFTRTTTVSSFFSEQEVTCFSSEGFVQTADGRTINFQVDLEMSRSFMEETMITDTTEQILCDPLVINLDAKAAKLTDHKFYFDLDADGVQDEISFVEEGSGFLALDQNGDGQINDGTELFGTLSGDGFADLAAYDNDKNGWIDENDAVFHRLKVWTKDAEGNNVLLDLKQADVGAIFLGKISTEFQLNRSDDNQNNGVIKSTGVYLKESTGAAHTMQHVDLAL